MDIHENQGVCIHKALFDAFDSLKSDKLRRPHDSSRFNKFDENDKTRRSMAFWIYK